MTLKVIRVTETLAARIASVRRTVGLFDDDGPPLEKIALCDELMRVIEQQEATRLARLPQRAGVRIINFSSASRRRAR
jgi:hypothetical protein